jgi:tetratricopeptide (TPR) repeat protein
MRIRLGTIAKTLPVLALTLAPALPAVGQVSSNWKGCTGNPDVDWARQIVACTALIDSGAETKENTAVAFYNRALAYENLEKFNEAIADYTRAIALDPENAEAYLYRGIDKTRIGEKAGGDVDIETAKRINPNIGR